MKILGIVPARGGSKSVEKKNVRHLLGKPLIAYTIESALSSVVDRVIVSTDDKVIAEIARDYGAEVPFLRPSNLAGDHSSSLSVIQHCIKHMEEKEGYYPDIIVFLQPTSPLRTTQNINEAIEKIINSDVDSIIGVRRVYEDHPYFMFKENQEKKLVEYVKIENKPSRRQDVPPCYLINSAMYISRRSYFEGLRDKDFVFNINSVIGYEMGKIESVDINDIVDFHLAEKLLNEIRNSK